MQFACHAVLIKQMITPQHKQNNNIDTKKNLLNLR